MTTYMFPDVEDQVVDVLGSLLDDLNVPTGTTVGTVKPRDWKPSDPPHIQVRVDASDASDMPIAGRTTVALVVHAKCAPTAKHVAAQVSAALDARTNLISAVPLTGPITARDDETNAELATVTLEVVARST